MNASAAHKYANLGALVVPIADDGIHGMGDDRTKPLLRGQAVRFTMYDCRWTMHA
jgi:hypothetical protein